MPALEMAQENGKLLAWRKKEGESVSKGEPLLEIETDKAVVEVEAPGDGFWRNYGGCGSGDSCWGDDCVAGGAGRETPAKAVTAAPAARATSAAQAAAAVPAQARPSTAAGVAAQISPKARRLAKELGLDTAQIQGTGLMARLRRRMCSRGKREARCCSGRCDWHNRSARTAEPVGAVDGERTTQSWTSVPHFFLVQSVDAGALIDAQKKLSQGARGHDSTITDLLIKVLARVLEKHPRMNASWVGDGVRLNAEINISVAMAVKDGVVAP